MWSLLHPATDETRLKVSRSGFSIPISWDRKTTSNSWSMPHLSLSWPQWDDVGVAQATYPYLAPYGVDELNGSVEECLGPRAEPLEELRRAYR